MKEVIVFILAVIMVGVGILIAAKDTRSMTSGHFRSSLQDALHRSFPVVFQSATSSAAASGSRKPLPSGFGIKDASPYYGQVFLRGLSQDKENIILEMELPEEAYSVGGWIVRGSVGSQLIGGEGVGKTGKLAIGIRPGVVSGLQDKVLLLDSDGKLVDALNY